MEYTTPPDEMNFSTEIAVFRNQRNKTHTALDLRLTEAVNNEIFIQTNTNELVRSRAHKINTCCGPEHLGEMHM